MRSLAKKTLGSTRTGRAIFLVGAEARRGAVDIFGEGEGVSWERWVGIRYGGLGGLRKVLGEGQCTLLTVGDVGMLVYLVCSN